MPSADSLVSIVILSWNRKDDLQRTLEAVSQHAGSLREAIVVDNGSTDGSLQLVQSRFPWVRTIGLPRNVGIEGLNIGMRAAKGEIIVLLDDDSYPLPDAIHRLWGAFQGDPRLGIAACRIVSPTASQTDTSAEETQQEVPTFIGCGVGIRRAAIERAGPFDSAFFLYGNELDLAARIMEAGYTVRYFPQIVFVHAVSPTNRTNLRREYYCTRNTLWTIWKYFPLNHAFRLSIRVSTEIIAYRLLRGDLQRTWAVARGVWGALTGRRGSLNRRVLSIETRQRLLTYIDLWYPPPWAWIRTRLRSRA